MKKLLLSTVFAAMMAPAFADIYSDNFSITFDGKQVANGETVTVSTYYDPIIVEYPEVKDDPEYESSFEAKGVVKIDNLNGSPAVVGLNLVRTEPSLDAFPSKGSEIGYFQLCYEISDGSANCLPINDNQINASNLTVPGSGYMKCDVDQQSFTSLIPTVFKLSITAAGASDPFVLNVNFTHTSDITMAVDGIEADASAPEFYNLLGVKVAHPKKGNVYIVKTGSKTTKRVF